MDLTVRRVATFFRAPWWSSISTVVLFGLEKQTFKWERFSTSLPVIVDSIDELHVLETGPEGRFSPRGPSTVTTLDLIWILTNTGQRESRGRKQTSFLYSPLSGTVRDS